MVVTTSRGIVDSETVTGSVTELAILDTGLEDVVVVIEVDSESLMIEWCAEI